MSEERPDYWPELRERLEEPGSRACVLPISEASPTFRNLGLARWSSLGAIAGNTGGLLLAHGWIRVFGGVGDAMGPRLPALDEVNRPGAEHFVVGCDILGGVFALDGGAFGEGDGKLHYFQPDALEWTGLGCGLSGFLEAMCSGVDAELYEDLRWPGWEAEAIMLGLDEGISIVPMLCTREAKPLANASRRAIPMEELVSSHAELARQVDGRAPHPKPSVTAETRD